MAFGLKSITGALGTAADYLTPGLGSNRLTDWSGWGNSSPAAPAAPAAAPKTSPALSAANAGAAGNSAAIAALNSQLASLQAQLAYQPKLPTFDVMGNYSRAKTQAEAAVNPLYEKYLNDFLVSQQHQKEAKQNEVQNTRTGIAQELQGTLGENQVNRTRTAEDTASAIQQLNTQEGQMQQDTGTQFDTDRRALAESTAAAGLTTSGLGQGIVFDQQNKRNLDEGRQVQEYNNQREAKNLFQTRTFEDMTRSDTQANQVAANKDQAAQFDLDSYLQQLSDQETSFRTENEVKRLGDVATQQQTYAQQGSQAFLASLAGSGWRPQDIALAYQVYG